MNGPGGYYTQSKVKDKKKKNYVTTYMWNLKNKTK